MKIKLVFDDWRGKHNESIYNTQEGVNLSSGQFHGGTTFNADIDLDEEDALELKEALNKGFTPIFSVVEE